MGDRDAEISGQGGAAAYKTTQDQQKMEFINLLKSKVLPEVSNEKIVALVEELQELDEIYAATDFTFMDLKDLKTLKSIRGVQLNRLVEYVQCQQDTQLARQPKPQAADETTDDQHKMELINLLKSEVLPTLPKEKMEALVEELQELYEIYSATDLSLMDLKVLKTLKSIRGVQLNRLLKYVQDKQCPQLPQQPKPQGPRAVAALIKGEGNVIMEGGRLAVRAGEIGSGQSGGGQAEAAAVIGKGNVYMGGGNADIDAGEGENKAIMDFTALLKEKVLPNLSWDEVKTFVKELKSAFGVVCKDDLPLAEFEELKNKIKSIKGVQLKRFLKYVEELKGKERTAATVSKINPQR